MISLNWKTLSRVLNAWEHKPGSYQHHMGIKDDYICSAIIRKGVLTLRLPPISIASFHPCSIPALVWFSSFWHQWRWTVACLPSSSSSRPCRSSAPACGSRFAAVAPYPPCDAAEQEQRHMRSGSPWSSSPVLSGLMSDRRGENVKITGDISEEWVEGNYSEEKALRNWQLKVRVLLLASGRRWSL